ncbi:Macrophage mannose receptor 1 [Labeo rohita]|uniref:Macrophage mannose receptor 1 n=1 Tax=Labeo rohita TaxID=84645 RepID=A0ABQ8MJ45_LABRO|nr:Macrophage mannose receptor 1 [Labeo rohita]
MDFVHRMLLTALLVGFIRVPWCFSRRYYIIDEFKNWTEAQDYCRKHYYDLATFDNKEEHNQVVQTLVSGGYTNSFWIGLYDDRYSWRWSNGEKNMTYTNWAAHEPDSYQSKEACTMIYYTGFWYDQTCEQSLSVLCYNEKKNWRDALNYCRLYHTDVAMIGNQDENTKLKLLLNINKLVEAYIGLYRDTWKWSDQSSSVFSAWMLSEPNNYGGVEFCGQLTLPNEQWADASCSKTLRFVCGTAKKIQILRINIQSALNLYVSDFNSTILQQLQQKLRNLGLPSNTKLTWRTQPDGQIFHILNKAKP